MTVAISICCINKLNAQNYNQEKVDQISKEIIKLKRTITDRCLVFAKGNARIVDIQCVAGTTLARVNNGTQVFISGNPLADYYTATYKNIKGYINSKDIQDTEQFKLYHTYTTKIKDLEISLRNWEQIKKNNDTSKKIATKKKIKKEKQLAKEKKEKTEKVRLAKIRKNKLIKEFGYTDGARIFYNKIWIGMTEHQLKLSKPYWQKINKSVYSNSVNKQYCYSDRTYVYVKNGIVTSYQESN